MPYTPRMPDDGEQPSIGFEEQWDGSLSAVNEGAVYNDDWQYPEVVEYAQGERQAITTISRGGGKATVRVNVPITYNVSVIFFGSYSGTVPAGATMTGGDANGNGIPDILEKAIKNGQVKMAKTTN